MTSTLKRLLFLSAALLALPATSSANPLVVRASRPNYAESEVARPVVLAKEWAQFTLEYDYRSVTRYTDNNGNVHAADYKYRMSWLTLGMRYGFTRNLTLFLDIPYAVQSQRTGGTDGNAAINATGLGDARFGFAWQFYTREKESSLSSVALQWDTKQPSGNESPGEVGNRRIPLGTGTTNSSLSLLAKQRFGLVAAQGHLGYVHKFSAVTQWVRDETGPAGLNGRIKPGDELDAGIHLIVQPVNIAGVDGGIDWIRRSEAAIGHTSNGIDPSSDLKTVAGSGFEAVNGSARVLIEPSVNWTISGGVIVPLKSYNSGFFFPLEDLSQSYGTTFIGSATFRW